MNRYILPIIVVALLGFALFKLNSGMSQNAQPDNDDDAAQTQQDTSKKPAAPPPPPSSTSGAHSAPGQASANAPDEVVVGDPAKAKYKITAGWSYNSANQSNSSQLTSTINELQKVAKSSNGQVSVQIVDVDVPQDQRSPSTRSIQDVGIAVNGKPISSDNLGEGGSAPQAVSSGIGPMVNH